MKMLKLPFVVSKLILLLLNSLVINGFAFNFLSSEVFIIPLNHMNFSLLTPDVKYRPSLLNMPDLPSWLHYTYSKSIHSGFIYGAPPPEESDLKLEVIATDEQTFNTSRRIYDLHIQSQASKLNEVRFKITNLNIDELLIGSRWNRLKNVLVDDLWPESGNDIAITSLDSATHKGDKLPLHPHDKEGTYISYGSSAPFSYALLELQMEVKPLWNHRPCPTYFKKSSKERFFREKGFAIDWCNFRLHENRREKVKIVSEKHNAAINNILQNLPVKHIKKSDVMSRSYVFDVIYMILIPLLVMLVLLALLTLAMCCHRDNMDLQSSIFFDEIFNDLPKLPTSHDIHMIHYAGINKAAGVLRSTTTKKRGTATTAEGADEEPPSMNTTTTIDVLPLRSPTASPDSTLHRQSTPSRRFEDYATLTRPNPPPYQRNGSTTPTRLV